VASSLGFARVWDTTTWKPVVTVGGFLHGVHFTTFSPDNRRLVISSDGAEAVRLCETESWGDVFTLSALGTGAGGAFSPDGDNIVWGNSSGTLYLWSAPSWAEIKAAEAKEKAAGPQP
jgi:WD40 repeat protein